MATNTAAAAAAADRRRRRATEAEGPRKKPVTTEIDEGVHAVAMIAAASEGVKLADVLERWLEAGARRAALQMKEQVLVEAKHRKQALERMETLAGLGDADE